MNFEKLINEVKDLNKKLNSKEKIYSMRELTERNVKDILQSEIPVPGNFLLYEDGVPVYVGRSCDLAQRIGTDLRSLGKNQANITKKILVENPDKYIDMHGAREYFFEHYTIKMIKIENVYVRSLLQIYASLELDTKYNSFLEH